MAKNKIRVDKFLWCTRFYKSRPLSKLACHKSKIKINGNSAKSSSTINIGDIVTIKKKILTITIEVISTLDKRVSAKLIDNYIKDITPESERIKLKARGEISVAYRERGKGRPTKKERRSMDKELGDYSKL